MANIKGVWIFNETIESINSNTVVSVNFTANGYSYTTMTCRNKDYAWPITYEPASPYNTVGYSATNGWVYSLAPPTSVPEIRTVDFGETEQTVPDVFYEWFTSNAIKQSIPEKYSIEKNTLTSFADQARRINGTTDDLTTAQMLEIFEGADFPEDLSSIADLLGNDVGSEKADIETSVSGLIGLTNETTGNTDTNLTDGVNALVSGYGQGGEVLPIAEECGF